MEDSLRDIFSSLFFSKGFLLFIIISFLIFILIREFFTWYWKINRIISLLEDIEENTNTRREIIKNIEEKNKKSKNENNINNKINKLFDGIPDYLIFLLGMIITVMIVIIIFNSIN